MTLNCHPFNLREANTVKNDLGQTAEPCYVPDDAPPVGTLVNFRLNNAVTQRVFLGLLWSAPQPHPAPVYRDEDGARVMDRKVYSYAILGLPKGADGEFIQQFTYSRQTGPNQPGWYVDPIKGTDDESLLRAQPGSESK